MSQRPAPVEIPDKPSFKPSEVCELLKVPTYVLRTWENEFKDLGTSPPAGGARTYRRRDVELAVRIRDLVFTEHLTLAGVRRRLEQEHVLAAPSEPEHEPASAAPVTAVAAPVREKLTRVRSELRLLLDHLTASPKADGASTQVPSDAPQSDGPASGIPAPAALDFEGGSDANPAPGPAVERPQAPILPGLEPAIPHVEETVSSPRRLDPAALDFATVSTPRPSTRRRSRAKN